MRLYKLIITREFYEQKVSNSDPMLLNLSANSQFRIVDTRDEYNNLVIVGYVVRPIPTKETGTVQYLRLPSRVSKLTEVPTVNLSNYNNVEVLDDLDNGVTKLVFV